MFSYYRMCSLTIECVLCSCLQLPCVWRGMCPYMSQFVPPACLLLARVRGCVLVGVLCVFRCVLVCVLCVFLCVFLYGCASLCEFQAGLPR